MNCVTLSDFFKHHLIRGSREFLSVQAGLLPGAKRIATIDLGLSMFANVMMMRIRRLNYSGWLLCPAVVASMMALSLTARAFSNQSEVKLPQYLGVWFEHARTTNQFQDNTLQRDGKEFGPCFAARTNYTADGDNAIKVQNACKRRAPDGSVITDRVTGKAVLQAGTQGRKLQIAFGSGIARFFQRAISGGGFAYWIYCIGPVNSSGLYDWAVVSGPEKDYVFVLTRQRSISEKVQAEILRCSRASALPVDKLIYRQSDQAR